ncbi:MAGUK p55 subfamily member 4-like isoform X1 [Scophthalmus maximus]|uniref:MAGUK p55 subfamily member 4-like isoform X1 n=2 Tax=Scophthalmus maximus TaxID=52904 RepID=UPI001FA85340|nr:MAGUK p55 subfamily member 4-like isoform X1 [Scophthalmus maximus]XP_047193176.1 MAGUK p55 subfamily member 4-like isoform X1 [Scophthalmus maximus]
MRQAMEDGISEVLSSVVDDVSHAVNRNVGGAQLLQELLGAPWLHALLQMYECLLQFKNLTPGPILPYASGLSHEIMTVIQKGHRPSAEARELYGLLGSPHMQALLSSHDSVAQSDYGPVLPPLPDDLPEDEEAVRIVCLVKNNQPLGATIRRDEDTGGIYIARVIHGGLADRSGLLHPGDLVVEVNGHPVGGLDPEQVIQMLIHSQGTILFKVIPKAAQSSSSQKPVYMRAMVDYFPQQDSSIPCPDAGMAFSRGDLLEVVDQSDGQWWQARKLPCAVSCAGLIPSASMLKSKHREQWWCEPLQVHTCIRPCEDAAASSSSSSSLLSPTSRHRRTIQHMQITNARSQIWKKLILVDEADSDVTDGIYLAGFRRTFRLWRRTSYRKRRQSCTSCSPSSSTLSSPYEEVALYQRPPQENHRLIILVGASGVGVSELRKRLIKLNPSTFQGPVPHTTRPMGAGEQTGREYHFVTKELFEYMVCNHRFVEYGEYRGHLYGTSTDAIDDVLKRGRMCVIDVEPHSIQPLRTRKLKPYVIFIKAPGPERLRQTRRHARLITNCSVNRAFTEDDFVELEEASRLMEAKYKHFFDCVLVNDDLQDACMQLCSVIQQAQEEPQWIPVSWGRPEE